ncbi:ankyrin repeat-containing domain protein [Aspergillus nidulans var. acristatus]
MFGGPPLEPSYPEPKSALQVSCESGDLDAVRAAASTADKDDLNAALCRACKKGHIAIILELLEIPGVDVNATFQGDTALFLATLNGEPDVIQLLLEKGADPGFKSRNNPVTERQPDSTPLFALVKQARRPGEDYTDHVERLMCCACLLLEAGCDINAADQQGWTVLHFCLRDRLRLAGFLVDQGANPNAKTQDGSTPMHLFWDLPNQPDTLKALIGHGARLDTVRASDGMTPLHLYAKHNMLGDLSLLRPYVSDWGLTDSNGNTLLHAAVQSLRAKEATQELLNLGLDPNQRNNDGCTPLHLLDMPADGLRDVLNILCAAGADLEAKDHKGRTPLARVMSPKPRYNYAEVLSTFIARGANLNTQDYNGNGVLHYIVRPYDFNFDHFQTLLSLGADPELANYKGDTVLHHLAANLATISDGKAVLAILDLLGRGMSPTIRNHKGRTPLHLLCGQVSQHYFMPSTVPQSSAIDVLLDAGLELGINSVDNDGAVPIHFAATVSETLVAKLISRGAVPTSTTKEGLNLLHIASRARQSNIVGLLLEHYKSTGQIALVNAHCKIGRAPLHDACRSGRLETVALLLQAGADVNAEDAKQKRVLDACAEFTAEEKLWEFTEDSMNLFHTLQTGGVLRDLATRPHQPSASKTRKRRVGLDEVRSEHDTVSIGPIVRLLAAHGAKLDPERRFSNNIMSAAIWGESAEMAVELERLAEQGVWDLQHRKNLEFEYLTMKWKELPALLDEEFRSSGYVIHYGLVKLILRGHHEEVVQALERNRDHVRDTSQRELAELLVVLARYGYHDLFARIGSLMSEQGWINGGTRTFGGRLIPYLFAAAQREMPNLDVIKVIVEKFHADVNLVFTNGLQMEPEVHFSSTVDAGRQYKPADTILHYLAQGGHWWHQGAIKYLLEHGADPNARNKQGKTPLCHAVTLGHLGGYGQQEIARILLEGGADPNIPAYCGWRPLSMAAHDTQLVKLLLEHGARPSPDHPMELFSALGSLNPAVLDAFLDAGIDVNTTVLSNAQPHWHTHRLQKLPGMPNYVLHPLHYMAMDVWNEIHARSKAIMMIQHLLRRGADPFLISDRQSPIVHLVFSSGGIIQPFLDMGTLDLERRDALGRTLLLAAASCATGTNSYAYSTALFQPTGTRINPAPYLEGDPTRAMTLYEKGADLTATDTSGNNVLHLLVQHEDQPSIRRRAVDPSKNYWIIEHQRTIRLFLEKAPQLATQRNNTGYTPWDIADNKLHSWALDVLPAPEAVETTSQS